jgi:hypothetical protein
LCDGLSGLKPSHKGYYTIASEINYPIERPQILECPD